MFVNGFAVPSHLASTEVEDLLGHEYMVSEVFSVDGRDEDYEHVFDWTDFTPAIWKDGAYEIVGLQDFEPCSVALRHMRETVGFYMGGQSWIQPVHRGRGHGSALVLSAIAFGGELPDIRDIGFTEAGYRTHLSALRSLWEMFPTTIPKL